MSTPALATFELAPDHEAAAPPEARGIARDGVRMMVAHRLAGIIEHSRFDRIAEHLAAGDALVVNVSRTLPAAVTAISPRGEELVLHFSSPYPADERLWVVELRLPAGPGTTPFRGVRAGDRLALPGGASIDLRAPYLGERLWVARSAPGRLGGELPRPPRPADPLRLRRRRLGSRRLPDHLRHRARQRRDAERGAPVHPPHARRAGGARHPGRADRPALRRLVARGRREPPARAVRGLAGVRRAPERGPRSRRQGRRDRDDGRPRARVGGRRRRRDPRRVRAGRTSSSAPTVR